MPKGKIQDPKRSGTRNTVAPVRKFKLGNRKSTRSALHLSEDDLRKIAEGRQGQDAQTARNELVRRNAA